MYISYNFYLLKIMKYELKSKDFGRFFRFL